MVVPAELFVPAELIVPAELVVMPTADEVVTSLVVCSWEDLVTIVVGDRELSRGVLRD